MQATELAPSVVSPVRRLSERALETAPVPSRRSVVAGSRSPISRILATLALASWTLGACTSAEQAPVSVDAGRDVPSVDGSTIDCRPSATMCRGGELVTCGADGRVASCGSRAT